MLSGPVGAARRPSDAATAPANAAFGGAFTTNVDANGALGGAIATDMATSAAFASEVMTNAMIDGAIADAVAAVDRARPAFLREFVEDSWTQVGIRISIRGVDGESRTLEDSAEPARRIDVGTMMPEQFADGIGGMRRRIARAIVGITALAATIFLIPVFASWVTGSFPFSDRFDPAAVPADDDLIAEFRENRVVYDQARTHFRGQRIRVNDPSHVTVIGDAGSRQGWQRRGGSWSRVDTDGHGARKESVRATKAEAERFQTMCDYVLRLHARSIDERLYADAFGQFAVCKFHVGNVASSVTKGIVYSETPPSYGVKLVDSTDGILEQKGMYCRLIDDDWYVCIEFH